MTTKAAALCSPDENIQLARSNGMERCEISMVVDVGYVRGSSGLVVGAVCCQPRQYCALRDTTGEKRSKRSHGTAWKKKKLLKGF